MSRIGKEPINIPSGVDVKIDNGLITVKGPKGQLERQVHNEIVVELDENQINVKRLSDNKMQKSLHGLTRSLIANMVEGVTKGFEKRLEINGVGYRAAKQGNKLVLTVGYSHPVELEEPPGIEFEVPAPNKITVKGADKELVGIIAANIRDYRKPDPYKGKGIKYENEHIRRKVGKTGA